MARGLHLGVRDDAPVGGLRRDLRALPPHHRHPADGGRDRHPSRLDGDESARHRRRPARVLPGRADPAAADRLGVDVAGFQPHQPGDGLRRSLPVHHRRSGAPQARVHARHHHAGSADDRRSSTQWPWPPRRRPSAHDHVRSGAAGHRCGDALRRQSGALASGRRRVRAQRAARGRRRDASAAGGRMPRSARPVGSSARSRSSGTRSSRTCTHRWRTRTTGGDSGSTRSSTTRRITA